MTTASTVAPGVGQGSNAFDDFRIGARIQTYRHHRKVCASGRVAMSVGAAEQTPIRPGRHVDVEIEIDFGCVHDHSIESIEHRAARCRIRMFRRGHLLMRGMVALGLHRAQIEALRVEQRTKQTELEHSNDLPGDAAGRDAANDLRRLHRLWTNFATASDVPSAPV